MVRNQNGQNYNFMKIAQKIENLKIWKKTPGGIHKMKWPKFKFHENWPKKSFGQKIF